MHRQLDAAQRKAAIEGAIEDLQQQIDAVRTGCVDFDLGNVLAKTEVRLLQMLRELERFEREVTQPAEELRAQRSSVRFSDSSADFRTNVATAP